MVNWEKSPGDAQDGPEWSKMALRAPWRFYGLFGSLGTFSKEFGRHFRVGEARGWAAAEDGTGAGSRLWGALRNMTAGRQYANSLKNCRNCALFPDLAQYRDFPSFLCEVI